MNEPIEYLTLGDIGRLLTNLFGATGHDLVRDLGLLGAAIERPRVSAFGTDAYPDLWTKAAALLHSLTHNHALVDGNKRLGWLATATFLLINGVDLTRASEDDIYDLVIDVVTVPMEIVEIAGHLQAVVAGQPGRSRGGVTSD